MSPNFYSTEALFTLHHFVAQEPMAGAVAELATASCYKLATLVLLTRPQ